jgi:hypothetical protein
MSTSQVLKGPVELLLRPLLLLIGLAAALLVLPALVLLFGSLLLG